MKKRILIIDDESDLLDAMKEKLHLHAFLCTTATSAKAGLKKAAKVKPDLVLLDLGLPDMSGFGFLREFKNNPALANIPVIILSGLSDEEVVKEGMDLGATGYLNKTCGARVLISTIRDYSAGE